MKSSANERERGRGRKGREKWGAGSFSGDLTNLGFPVGVGGKAKCDVAAIEVTGSEAAPGRGDRAWWRVWQAGA